MSMVNDTHRFVFLHVAKTGGRSINLLLKGRYGRDGVFNTKRLDPNVDRLGRMLGLEARAFVGEDRWNDYFTFAFARNPWDRAVSIFEHMRTDFQASLTHPAGKMTGKAQLLVSIGQALQVGPLDLTFTRFIHDILRDRAIENYHWDLQSNALTDGRGQVLFDFIGRFERLQQDFDLICDRLGLAQEKLPHFNRSKRNAWPEYYAPQTMRVISKIYAEDFELLGYAAPR